jgi:CRP/FNR family transcriptional regulator, dissimilatory nitrate respiration regulator
LKTPNAAAREWLPHMEKLGRERSLARGEILFRKDDAAVGIYEFERGQVRLSRLDQTGHEIVLHTAGPGDLIGEASLFSHVYHCDAIAVTDTRARLYPKEALLAAFRRNPEAAEAFASRLAHELMALRTRLQVRNIRSARERVQTYLTLNTGADGRTVALKGTVKDLAAELGFSHEALYRTLKKLEAEGTIARTTDKIILQKTGGI